MKRVGLQTLGLGMIATSLWLAVPSVVSAAAAVDTSTATTNKPVVVQVAGQVVKQPPEIWLTFGLDRVPLLHYKLIGGIPAWQFLASFVYIILAFYVSKFLDYFIRSRVQAWAARTANRFDDMVVELVRGPVKVVSFVVLLHIGMKVYSWPESLASAFSAGLKIIVAVSITYVSLKAVDAFMTVWKERTTTAENEQFSRQLLPLLGKSIKVFVVVVAVLVTSQNLGLNVTGLIASLSIGGLALGLAAQDTLANLFGAVSVLIDKPFKVGDRIRLEAVDGVVESIGFRSTRVRNLDGHLVTVPNKTMGNATIVNVTLRPNIKTALNLGLTYDTSPERVQRATQLVQQIFRSYPQTEDVWVTFDKFADFALNLQIIHWWKGTDFKEFLAALHDINLRIKRAFDEEKIEFAFPTQTLYVKGGDGQLLPAGKVGEAQPQGQMPGAS